MAEAQVGKTKLTKSEKKAAKKQAKSQQLLLKHDGISTSDTPTKFLLVGNGGLINGIQHEELSLLFKQYGDVEEIVMLPGKPYSFACFKLTEEAVKAQDKLNGYQLRDGQGPANIKMYLSFVKQVPIGTTTTAGLPPGLILIEKFIDEEMENTLLSSIEWDDESAATETAQQSLKHRRVKHHGYEFLYSTNNIDKEHPLPDGIPAIYGKVIDDIMATGHVQYRPNQLTINQYQPGQGIPSHVDTHSAFEDAIISLSLGSQVLMEFHHPDGRHIPVLLPARSLTIMTKEARYLWAHGITPRKSDVVPAKANEECMAKGGLTLVPRGLRTSLTFRAIRKEPCNCDYPIRCDSQKDKTVSEEQNPSASLPDSEHEAAILEQTHVHEVYEKIAEHFSDTRHKPWPRVAEFLNKLKPWSVCLDVGCGNGKYLGVNDKLYMIGCDRSQHLVDICRQRQFQSFTSDALQLPIHSQSVDACICIAVIHHFSTQARREKAVTEILRILRPGGLGLIYVWAVEQERNKQKSNYIKGSKEANEVSKSSNDIKSKATTDARKVMHGDSKSKIQAEAAMCSDRTINESTNVRNVDKSRTTATDYIRKLDISNDMNSATNCADPPGRNSASSDVNSVDVSLGETSKKGEDSISDRPAPKKLLIHKNRTQFVQPDLLVPWHLKPKKGGKEDSASKESVKADNVVYHRYYHVFREGELEELCLNAGDVKIADGYYDQGNWCVIFQKTDC